MVYDINDLIHKNNEYSNKMGIVKDLVNRGIDSYLKEAEYFEEYEKKYLDSFYMSIKNIVWHFDEQSIKRYFEIVDFIENKYVEDFIAGSFIIIIFTTLFYRYPTVMSLVGIDEQVLICEVIDSIGDDIDDSIKYIRLLINPLIRAKFEEAKEKTSFKVPDIFLYVVEHLEEIGLDYSVITDEVVNCVIEYLNQYVEDIKYPLFDSLIKAYEYFSEQYYYFRGYCLPSEDNYDDVFIKLNEIIYRKKYGFLHDEILAIIISEKPLLEKIKLLSELIAPYESKVLVVNFARKRMN